VGVVLEVVAFEALEVVAFEALEVVAFEARLTLQS
jgi:hypothetical protein